MHYKSALRFIELKAAITPKACALNKSTGRWCCRLVHGILLRDLGPELVNIRPFQMVQYQHSQSETIVRRLCAFACLLETTA
jgi:hypothetical protein